MADSRVAMVQEEVENTLQTQTSNFAALGNEM